MAIAGWILWLTASGKSRSTLELRRDQIRTAARRSGTPSPAYVTTDVLLTQCGAAAASLEHRRSMRTALVSFFEWCVANGHAQSNPAAALPKVQPAKPRPRPAPDDVWQGLLTSAPPRELLMIRLAGEAGMRRGEVARCRVDDLLDGPSGASLIVHGKGGKQRIVPVSDSLAELIRAGAAGHSPDLGRGAHGFLFPGGEDGHLSVKRVGQAISHLMPAGYTMHMLRHRFATRAYRGSRNIRAVQMLLGHTSVATTERYTAVDDDEIRAAMMSAQTDG